ncbi:hypothetical protein DFH09DRAFT_1332994 [Mycena vulgaris]|nr:hypothetical protein DFH09DRAFT_1332994 [Mycena vulgaris]
MSSPKTTWEDLSRLGWPINNVFKLANEWRHGTMGGIQHISLNSGVAANWQWWSYNTTIGQPYLLGRRPTSISREETAWEYDNTQNSKPHEEHWTEAWTNSTTATLISSSRTPWPVQYSVGNASLGVASKDSRHGRGLRARMSSLEGSFAL